MYVKAYLDLSVKFLVCVLWLRFSARAPGSLARGFLVSRRCCVVVLPMAFGPEADS